MTTTTTRDSRPLPAAMPLDLRAVRERLERSGGGCKSCHSASAFEIRVEVFASPGPGTTRVEPRDALYVALDGNGVLGVSESGPVTLTCGEAAVVPAGATHVVFGNPRLSLLVVLAQGEPSWLGSLRV